MAEKRILMIHVDPVVLEDFRRALGRQWEVVSAASGAEAFAELAKSPCDVLVADINLPDLDCAELLNRIQKEHAGIIRFILADDSDRERVMKQVLGAHQFLSRPCNVVLLKASIERALALGNWITSTSMRQLVARVRSFPTVPSLYLEVLAALRSSNATTEQIGAIIAKDMAMTTKLLRVINSACFGFPRKITDPVEAVGLLGFDTVKSMVMTLKLLSQYDKVKPVYFSVDRLWRHSTEVGRIAREVALIETNDRATADAAFTAGLMHDVGKAVLAANFDEQYRGVQSLAQKQQMALWEVEREIFGATHAEIGAYLLGLWGMPLDLLETAALHHQPSRTITKGFTTLTAVHVANVFEHELKPDTEGLPVPIIDEAYLEEQGLLGRVAEWRYAAANVPAEDSDVRVRPVRTTPKPSPSISPASTAHTAAVGRSSAPSPGVSRPSSVTVPRPTATRLTVPSRGRTPAFLSQKLLYPAMALVLFAVAGWCVTHPFPSAPTVTARAHARSIQPPSGAVGLRAITQAANDGVGANAVHGNLVSNPPTTVSGTSGAPAAITASQPSTPEKTAERPRSPELKLQGIFYSLNHPSAIINGRSLGVNDQLGEFRVLEINASSVVLQSGSGRKVLSLQ